MASRYDEFEDEFNVSKVELEKADITLAALLNGYMLKRARLGKDDHDMFFKMVKGEEPKTFAIPIGQKQISDKERSVMNNHLGLNGREIDDEYLLGLLGSYSKETIQLFITSTYESLVENNQRDSVELKSYYTARLAQIMEANRQRNQTESQPERE